MEVERLGPESLPAQVVPLLDELLEGARDALGDNFIGLYLRGSLSMGFFDPKTSDIDILVVTDKPVSDAEFRVLGELHRRIPPDDNVSGRPYEVSYIDRTSIRRFEPSQRRHLSVGWDLPFGRYEHRPNWVLERWTVRERGVVVYGPDPKTLIDPISTTEIREAVREELQERLASWSDGSWPAEEMTHRAAQVFEIETVCRAIQTIEKGELTTKQEAVDWALDTLPEPWRSLIEWSQGYRGDRTVDEVKVPQVMSFLRWATLNSDAGS
jgi:hypothetical protein